MLVAKPIIQPILPIFDHGILDPASSSVKYLGGSGQGMTWPEALEIRMASPSSVKVKPTSVGKQPFGHLLQLVTAAIDGWDLNGFDDKSLKNVEYTLDIA